MEEPSFSHKRPRFGCRGGTFSYSCRQTRRRSTRLWLVHQPAPAQHCDPAVAIPAIQLGQGDNLVPYRRFVVRHGRRLALRRAVLAEGQVRQLRTWLGRLVRDIGRKITGIVRPDPNKHFRNLRRLLKVPSKL
jgi:hypothetical protein